MDGISHFLIHQVSGNIWHDHVDATWHPRGVTHGMSHVVHLCEWLTWSQVSREGSMRKINQENEIKSRKIERMTSGMGKVGGSFPHF